MKAEKIRKTKILVGLMIVLSLMLVSPVVAIPGDNDNGILNEEWRYDYFTYFWGYFGASPAIADLGPDVNTQGVEPDADLEIFSGSDDMGQFFPELGTFAVGIWRCFDSQGNIEWAIDTQSDEARGDPVIIDLDGDGFLELIGGTTSGETIEVMDRFGNFVWTFPDPPNSGNFMWDGGPAVADLDSQVSGLEIVASNRHLHQIFAFDGDNSDGIDDGYTWPGGPPWMGIEGIDWDILWVFTVPNPCEIYATVAIADVDNDGELEVVFGATDGNFYVVNGLTGALETSFSTGGAIFASAAVCNIDSDPFLEMVIGSTDSNIYAFEWDGTTASMEWTFPTGGPVFSSAGIGDIDGDGSVEVVVGSNDGNIYALDGTGAMEWSYLTGGAVYSSPSLAKRGGPGLGVYVGSEDTYLYALDGNGVLIDRFETFSGQCGNGSGIHTSPSIADVDGDGKLEMFFYDWGCGNTGNTFWAVEDSSSNVGAYSIEWANFRCNPERTGCYRTKTISVEIDIKPQSCPNPLRVNFRGKGVLPVAILGSEDFDVLDIDVDTITLEGVALLRSSVGDVSTPFEGEDCECGTDGQDGFDDLNLKFDRADILDALEAAYGAPLLSDLPNRAEISLTLTAMLLDGTSIEGTDCLRILNRGAIKRRR